MSELAFVSKAKAHLLAYLTYKPCAFVHPTKAQVVKNNEGTLPLDMADYETWEREEFELTNGDVTIPAEYHPVAGAKGVAILAHGFGQNRYVMIPQARLFRQMGYSTVLFDQRHFGASKAPNGTFSVREATDLAALVRWAKDRFGQDARVVVLGVSMGAMTVMHALGQTDLIDAAVEDCGPAALENAVPYLYQSLSKEPNPYLLDVVRRTSAKYGAPSQQNKPVDDVAKSDTPLLVIHGDADSTVPVENAHQVIAATKNPLSRMRVFPGREHAYSICDLEEYRETLAAFLHDVFHE